MHAYINTETIVLFVDQIVEILKEKIIIYLAYMKWF